MTVTEVIFYFIAAVSVLGGLGVVVSRNVAYAALSLVFTLLAVAALYILLASEFLALVQVLIYAGAVAVLLLFALMLTRARDLQQTLDGSQRPLAVDRGAGPPGRAHRDDRPHRLAPRGGRAGAGAASTPSATPSSAPGSCPSRSPRWCCWWRWSGPSS